MITTLYIVTIAFLAQPQAVSGRPPAQALELPDYMRHGGQALRPGPTPGVMLDREGNEVIVNYWKHVKYLHDLEAAKPPPSPDAAEMRYPPTRTFPFEALDHLEPEDLIRAAQEGVAEAEAQADESTPQKVHYRRAKANVRICLEYYPVIAKGEEAVNLLINVIDSEGRHPAFREFLVHRAAPGMASRSLFAGYFQDTLLRKRTRIRAVLRENIEAPSETPAMQQLAMKGLYYILRYDYTRALEDDAAIVAFARELAQQDTAPAPPEVTPKILMRPGAPEPGEETQRVIDDLAPDFERLVSAVAKRLDPASGYPDEIRRASRTLLVQMLAEIPLPDPAAAQALIEKHAAP